MSPLSTVGNAVFSAVLFVACTISAVLAYRWAVAPVLDYYNITVTIPLRDISAYIQALHPQRANDIALAGPDELEAGVGVSNLGRRNVTQTRRHAKWEKRVRWVDQLEPDQDEFFDVASVASAASASAAGDITAADAARQLGGVRE